MSTLLRKFIRTLLEAEDRNANVPNQLITPGKKNKKDEDDEKESVEEFSAAGGGAVAGAPAAPMGGNTMASGNIAGYTLPLGMSAGGVPQKKKKKKLKRTYV